MKLIRLILIACLAAVTLAQPTAQAQIAIIRNGPQTGRPAEFRISSVDINADIQDQVATVQIAQTFHNISRRTLETQFLFPLPDDAAVQSLTLIVDGKELPGELKKKEDARKIYEEIVRRQQDPALLEYMERGLFRTSVFPIPAGQKRRVEIRYTQLLKNDSGLVDFTLPLGTVKHNTKAVEQVNIAVRIKASGELKNIYSPTHDFQIERPSDRRATCRLTLHNVSAPDDVRLLYAVRGGDVGIDLISYRPNDNEQGYFLMLASPRVKARKGQVIAKTVVFVVDRSGSMSGEKIRQAKAALKYMINALGEKDTFNIISYSSEVEMFREELEVVSDKTRKQALQYVEDIYSGGGTNINDALTTALQQLQDRDRPGYVLFFTDGLPTVGVTSEKEIAANAGKANNAKARVFSFGVGYDVNSRLLDRLSRDQRGTSVYVKPEEDIEVASTSLFRKVSSPAMTDISLRFISESEKDTGKLVNRVIPRDLPDLFRGEQLIVVGRYKKSIPVTIDLTGKVGGRSQTMTHQAEFGTAAKTHRNAYVATLWATRRIGEIIDELDLNGHNQELVDELVQLSLKYGIMTPYTSFLADEDVSLNDRRRLLTEAESRTQRGLSMAGGYGGFAQRQFKKSLQNASRGNQLNAPAAEQADAFSAVPLSQNGAGSAGRPVTGSNKSRAAGSAQATPLGRSYATPAGPRGSAQNEGKADKPAARVRRISAKTFYWKNGEWQDAELSADDAADKQPDNDSIEVIEQFSSRYFELARLDNGRWNIYLTLKEPVLVKIRDKAYRVVPPAKQQ